MHTQVPVVQHYRRTDQDRLGQWAPVGSSWKSTASSGLVAHDIYHHLPADVGTFAQEVASLGAEWYVDIQALGSNPAPRIDAWPLSGFERNVIDTVLNALDSREKRPFHLPVHDAAALSETELAFFQLMAQRVHDILAKSKDARALDRVNFEQRFVQNLLWGYAQAQARFPDQAAVRKGSKNLALDLANLELSDVPYGHEVAITLEGYRCVISYSDADALFLQEHEVMPAVMMAWCSCEPGYPAKHVTLHRTARDYAEHVSNHFALQDNQGIAEELLLIPEGEQHELSQVYVRDADMQEQLRAGLTVTLPVSLMHMSDYTPRGVRVI